MILFRIGRGRFMREIARCDVSRQEVYGYRVSRRVDLNAKSRPLRRVNSDGLRVGDGPGKRRRGRDEKSGAENRFQWGTLAELCPRRHGRLRCISWLFFITAPGNTYKYAGRAIFPSIGPFLAEWNYAIFPVIILHLHCTGSFIDL